MNCRHCFHWTEAGEECCECFHLVKHPPIDKNIKAIERVRELHYREIDTSDYHCAECSDTEYGHYIDYPCNTIKALDGEQ